MKCWEALMELRERGPLKPSSGICENVDLIDERAGDVFHSNAWKMYERWPQYSGWLAYPVLSGVAGVNPRQAYWRGNTLSKWLEGPYAENRRALLDFAIEWFKERGL